MTGLESGPFQYPPYPSVTSREDRKWRPIHYFRFLTVYLNHASFLPLHLVCDLERVKWQLNQFLVIGTALYAPIFIWNSGMVWSKPSEATAWSHVLSDFRDFIHIIKIVIYSWQGRSKTESPRSFSCNSVSKHAGRCKIDVRIKVQTLHWFIS